MARIVFADPSEGQTDFYADRDLISESLANIAVKRQQCVPTTHQVS